MTPRAPSRVAPRWLVFPLAISLALTSTATFSQPRKGPAGKPPAAAADPNDREAQANALADEANAALKNKNYAEAAIKFAQADIKLPRPTTKLALARARIALNQLVEAHKVLSEIVKTPPEDGWKQSWKDAHRDAGELLKTVESQLGALDLGVSGPPADVTPQLTIDDALVPANEVAKVHVLTPGTHSVRLTAPGFLPYEKSLQFPAGSVQKVLAVMTPIKPPAPEPTASASASASAPLPPPPPPAVTSAPPPRPLPPPPPPPEEKKGGGALTGLGFTFFGLGLAAGAATGILAYQKADALKNNCGADKNACPASSQADIDDGKKFGTLSTISFAVAGGGLVLGIIGLATSGSSSGSAQAGRVQVGVGPGSIAVKGGF